MAAAGGDESIFSDDDDDDDGGDEERDQRVQDLLDLIRNTIEPDSWRANGGLDAAIAELNGQLVVTQTPSAHQEVADLLERLREQQAIQVAIESRFITVQSNFLEELGLDLTSCSTTAMPRLTSFPAPPREAGASSTR